MPGFYDIVIVARNTAAEADYNKIMSAFKYLLRKAGLLSYEKNTDMDN